MLLNTHVAGLISSRCSNAIIGKTMSASVVQSRGAWFYRLDKVHLVEGGVVPVFPVCAVFFGVSKADGVAVAAA